VRDDFDILAVLRSIDRRLALLTGGQERDLRQKLVSELLRTPARVRMFDAIDGQTGSPELARIAGASERAAQSLVQELRDLGLVRVATQTTGRGFAVEKDEDAIVQWYVQLVARSGDTEDGSE
jgi:hypothetical protein